MRYKLLHDIGPRREEDGSLSGGYRAGSELEEEDLGDPKDVERFRALGAIEPALVPSGSEPGPPVVKRLELPAPAAPEAAKGEKPAEPLRPPPAGRRGANKPPEPPRPPEGRDVGKDVGKE